MTGPTKDEAPIAAGLASKHSEHESHDCAAAADAAPAHDAARKAFAYAAAVAAQAGCTLHELSSGGYLLGRWTMCREVPDLRAVHALLARMRVNQ